MGHEYMAAFRTARQTAVRLARAGAPALRFDFYGCGDSAGDAADGRPAQWLDDVGTAIEQLRARQGAAEVSMLGMRLGASLALMHLQRAPGAEVRALVLWDPVILGKAYVAELETLQRERFGRAHAEVLGFPFTSTLRDELAAIDLSTPAQLRAREVLIVETGPPRDETRALAERLRALGSAVDHRQFDERPLWHEPGKSAVSAAVVQAVVAWTSARC